MGDSAAKADEYMKQAEKKLKGWGMFSNKYEEAAELYEKAGNNYKLAKCWGDAADAYEKLAEVQLKAESKHEAATAYVEASRAASKVTPAKSTELLQQAVALYTDMGRLNMAARQLKEIAEQNEKQKNMPEAITFYEQAAELFECEGSSSEATKCKLKIAEFAAEMGNYTRAVEIFEDAARRAVDNNLLKFSARGYLLNAGICYLCYGSVDDIETKIEQYRDIDLQFGGSREDSLLTSLHEAFADANDQAFSTALAEFDRVTRLDAWKTKILLDAKRRLADMELGVGGGGDGGYDDDDDDVL